MRRAEETIQSQYAASPAVRALAESFFARLDPADDVALFYDAVFNPDTARGAGLDVWGRIVGVERSLRVSAGDWFGFYGSGLQPFDQGTFFKGESVTGVSELSDEAFRRLVFWKAMANVSSADAASVNALLSAMFPDKVVYLLESGVMRARLVLETSLQPYERAILEQCGVAALGAGVALEWLEVNAPVLGFAGSSFSPFGQAPFFNGSMTEELSMNASALSRIEEEMARLAAQVSELQNALAELSRQAVFHAADAGASEADDDRR